MTVVEFSPNDMRIVMLAVERVSLSLKLTDSDEHCAIKSRVSGLIIECAEGGERDLQKLIDYAHDGLTIKQS